MNHSQSVDLRPRMPVTRKLLDKISQNCHHVKTDSLLSLS